ncbi:MAG: SemiSWEET transporter [Alphaproteobacteria bacterium]
MNPEWVGYLAAILITFAYMPQTFKVVHERNTTSISLGMYVLASAGAACWLWYGILIDSWPIILCNGITLGLALTILLMKLRHG